MRGAQDLGGRPGFGAINAEANEPIFHADWERRVMAFTVAMGASRAWTGDQSRHEREKLPEAFYWSANYYEIWMTALVKLLRDRGMVTGEEVASGKMVVPPKPPPRVLKGADVAPLMAKGFPYDRVPSSPVRFKPGDRIRTTSTETPGHTRLPGYAHGKCGEIIAVHGCHVFPDSNGMGQGEDPRWLYGVRFTARELWGRAGPDSVMIDLWEPYLEPA